MFWRDSGAVIGHGDQRVVTHAFDADAYGRFVRAVLDGVVENVGQCFTKHEAIDGNDQTIVPASPRDRRKSALILSSTSSNPPRYTLRTDSADS